MTFILPNILFVIFVAIATSYLTFLTTKGGLTDNRFSGFWKKLTRRGKTVLFVLFAIAILLVLQEINAKIIERKREKENDKKDLLLKKERNERDSTVTAGIKVGVDSSSRKLYDDISKAFAKQEFRLDTLNKEIARVRDSAKSITNIYSQPDPVLHIEINGIFRYSKTENSIKYSVHFKSDDAGSTNFNIQSYILTRYDHMKYDISKGNFFPKNLKIPKGGKWETGFRTSNLEPVKDIIIYLKGTYTTLDGTKSYEIDDMYDFDEEKNRVDLLSNSIRREILKIIESIPKGKLIISD